LNNSERGKTALLKVSKMSEKLNYHNVLFEESPCPMWVLDQQSMEFLEVNPAAIKQYGYSKEEFLKMKLPDVRFDGEVHKGMKLRAVVQSQMAGAFYDLGNSCHKRQNGEAFYVHVYSQHIQFDGRDALLAYLIDDNERVVAEIKNSKLLETALEATQKLRRQNEQLKEIAWIQSHKVRSHVATILGLIPLLKYSDDTDDDTRTIIDGIKEASISLDAIIREIDEKTKRSDLE
jgi:PAS domain S-box-containing protein